MTTTYYVAHANGVETLTDVEDTTAFGDVDGGELVVTARDGTVHHFFGTQGAEVRASETPGGMVAVSVDPGEAWAYKPDTFVFAKHKSLVIKSVGARRRW